MAVFTRTMWVSLPGLLELAIFGGVDAYVPMVGQGRKWVQSARLVNRRRFLSLRGSQVEPSIWTRSPGEGSCAHSPPAAALKFLDRQLGTRILGRIGEADWAQPTRMARAPAIPGWALALTWALFRRGGAHARCGTHVCQVVLVTVTLHG